jgi:hypothetical protein
MSRDRDVNLLAELEREREFAPGWYGEESDAIVIEVDDLGERLDPEYNRIYPIVSGVVLSGTEHSGQEIPAGERRAVHCKREVLAAEMARAAPVIGDRVAVKFVGKPDGKRYFRYRVVKAGERAAAGLAWEKYTGEQVAPVERSIAERLEQDDDPVPF